MRFLVLFMVSASLGQTLSGVVSDKTTGEPLSGVTITVDGTRLGTVSDRDGRFRLTAPVGEPASLSFKLLGYLPARHTNLQPASHSLAIALEQTVLPMQSVLVTASRSRAQTWSGATATLGHQEVQARHTVQDLPVLLSELPSTTFYSESGNGLGYTYLNIRGFDQRRIAVLINGVPQNDPEDHMVYWLDFPDLAANLEDIQVQRGAGNLWSGTPAIGGAVNLITTNFSRQRGIALTAGYGSFNTRKLGLSASSGLIENRYAIYGRLSKISSDGYRDNSWVDFNSFFLGAARFDKEMTTQINVYGGPVSDHLAYYGVSKAALDDRTLRRQNPIGRPEEIENFSQPHYEVIHEWRLGSATLHNTLFYVHGEGFYDYDGSWAPYSYYRLTAENGFAITGDPDTLYIPNALIHAYVRNGQWGWMPRAQIHHGAGVLTLGGEARWHRSLHYGTLKWGEALPAGLTPDYRYYAYRGGKKMFSLYANEIYPLSERWKALAEVTLVHHRYRLHDEAYLGNAFEVPYTFLNPKMGLHFQITSRWLAYGTLARTSREPRLKNLYDAAEASTPAIWGAPVTPQFRQRSDGLYDFDQPLVKQETMDNLEIGGGYQDQRLSLTANFYRMDFRNEIVKSGQLDRFGQPVTGNAEKTRHAGVEMMLRARPFSHWEFSGNLTWSDNKLIRHTQYDGTGAVKLDGKTIAGFPGLIANGRLSYHAGGWSATLSGRHVGAFYTTHFQRPQQRVEAATLADAHLGYRLATVPGLQSLTWQLSITNLFDALYAAGGEGDAFFPGATRNFYLGMNLEL